MREGGDGRPALDGREGEQSGMCVWGAARVCSRYFTRKRKGRRAGSSTPQKRARPEEEQQQGTEEQVSNWLLLLLLLPRGTLGAEFSWMTMHVWVSRMAGQ